MSFNCDSCGLCCLNIRGIKELENFMQSDGSCVNLDKDTKLCKIYDTRPTICRVDEMYELKYFKYFLKDEFYRLNENACKILKDKFKG
ncbi:YkgJ family cysteine cluster protein [Campylobacter mucosalis]|uniref:YkgJ family cysteine cluster protein n=1 Tax=Campylobacter mucosalis TaxID=202 RepID=UPI00146FCA8C|nr:YkgJ family cysteine cluster protein [Campylobacter mucosalis]